jgi:hypothetical protein
VVTTFIHRPSISMTSGTVLLRSTFVLWYRLRMEMVSGPSQASRSGTESASHCAPCLKVSHTSAAPPRNPHSTSVECRGSLESLVRGAAFPTRSWRSLVPNPAMAWEANPVGVASAFCFQLRARPIAIMAPRTADSESRSSRFPSNVVTGTLPGGMDF